MFEMEFVYQINSLKELKYKYNVNVEVLLT